MCASGRRKKDLNEKDELVKELIKEIMNPAIHVKIVKEKKGVPTVIEWRGNKYVLNHTDHLKKVKL